MSTYYHLHFNQTNKRILTRVIRLTITKIMCNRNCNYYLDCKTVCTVRPCSHRGTEVTLWEDHKERKVYCTTCGNNRIVRKYTRRAICPFANVCSRSFTCPMARTPMVRPTVINNDVYVVFL